MHSIRLEDKICPKLIINLKDLLNRLRDSWTLVSVTILLDWNVQIDGVIDKKCRR